MQCRHQSNTFASQTPLSTPIKHQRNDGRELRVRYLERLETLTTIDSRGARPRNTGMRISRSRDAGIVDRGSLANARGYC